MRTVLLLCIGLLTFAGCSGNSGSDPSPSPTLPSVNVSEPLDELQWTGTACAELGLFITAPASGVRPYVHPNFTLVEAQGMATVIVAFARCTSATVFDNTTNNIVMSDVGVYVDDPDGGPAPVFYQFWHASNRPATTENMSRVGLATQEAPNSNFLTFGLVQATLIESRISSTEGPYLTSATSVAGSAAAPARAIRWWHASENGTMYTDFTAAFKSAGPARGNISAEAGSDLAQILGGTKVEGEGVYLTFDLAAHARRVG